MSFLDSVKEFDGSVNIQGGNHLCPFFIEVLSPTLLHPPEPVEMGITEQQELGYMPLRDDFEKVTLFPVCNRGILLNISVV